MCYSRSCPHELWPSGECGKRKNQICPQSLENPDDYEQAAQELEDEYTAHMEQKYDEMRDRRWE